MAGEMWVLIIKNNSGSTQLIEDLGISITDGSQVDFASQFTYTEIANSDDLRALVSAGDLVVNDGIGDLSATDGVEYLDVVHIYYLKDNYFTKTNLGTAGEATVEYANLINVPAFGDMSWVEPVEIRVLNLSSTPPTGAVAEQAYLDTDNDHYYIYNGATWIDQGMASDGDVVINLDDAEEGFYTYNAATSAWTDTYTPSESDAVMVANDGDGKTSQYVYQGGTWVKIADVDFAGHFDGGASKHDASEIDVEGTYTNIPSAPSDLETVISDIDSSLTSIATSAQDHNTLDEAYDQGGAGLGRAVIVDSGPVKLDASTSTDAPLELTPKATLPTTNLNGGQLTVKDGILFVYDDTRSKWLSVERVVVAFGRRGNTKDQKLNFFGGTLSSNNSGIRMYRDAVITAISAQYDSANVGLSTNEVFKNDGVVAVASLGVTSANGGSNSTVNIDLTSGDYLQSGISGARAEDPMILVEIAWRA